MLMKLQTKYGGTGVNHTVQRIIDESTLIQIFRDLHLTFERNLALGHLTTRHTDPDMTLTFRALLRYLERTQPHEIKRGRGSKHTIKEMVDQGQWQSIYTRALSDYHDTFETSDPGAIAEEEAEASLEDVTVEVGV